jgi:Family of unknown function (DUF6600)
VGGGGRFVKVLENDAMNRFNEGAMKPLKLRMLSILAGATLVLGPGSNQTLLSGAEPELDSPAETASSLGLASDNLGEVMRLLEAGVEEPVVLAYIESCRTPFQLSAEDVIHLKDLGVSSGVITALLHQDTVLRDQQLQVGAASSATNQFVYDQKLYPASTDVAPAAFPEPVYVTNAPTEVANFYSPLDPYGSWIALEGLGWCWQPRIVVLNRYWRPYWDGGHWVYTDLGWYWQSDYSWRWAAFHYGRWQHHPRHGWVWFPGPTWAPAWVCWRYSDAYCGWAPLPPGAHFEAGVGFRFHNAAVGVNFDFDLNPEWFSFVEIGHFYDPHPHLHGLPAARVKEIYKQTRVVNDYVAGPNHTVINHGLAVNRVAAAGRREIRPVIIRELPAASRGAIRPGRVERIGSSSVIYRAEPASPARPRPMTAQKIDEHHPVIKPRPLQVPASTRTIRSQPTLTRPAPSKPAPPARPPAASPAPAPSRPRSVAPPRVKPSPPPRFESPRGRDHRISRGEPMKRPPDKR